MKPIYLGVDTNRNLGSQLNSARPATVQSPAPLLRGYWEGFLRFSAAQQPNFYAWLGVALFVQGCVLAPATVYSIVHNGNLFALYIPCVLAFALTEVCLLSFTPTKITLPVFFAGILTDVIVIALSFLLR